MRGRAAAVGLGLVVLAGVIGPWLGYDVGTDVAAARASQGPSAAHWLGTDHLGRDVAWRLLLACRAFVGPGLGAAATALALAVPLGALAGYRGGLAEAATRAGFTVVSAVPRFVLVLLAVAIVSPEPAVLAAAAGLTYVPHLGDAVRARISDARRAEFVAGLRAHGVPPWQLVGRHLVVALCGRLIARHAIGVFAYVVVLETTLAYIGSYGVQEPMPSWGNMLTFEWGRDNPVAAWAPVVALGAVLWLCHAAADALREADGGR